MFVDEIDKQYTIKFPDDSQFTHDIKNNPPYGKRLAKYILEEYEIGLLGGDTYTSPETFSIDHIMPQTLPTTWRPHVDTKEHL